MKWAVSFPEESILLVRPCLTAICAGNRPAGKLLSVLLYRYSIRQEHKTDAENINEVKGDDSQDTTFRIYRKQSQLVTDMCDEITEKTLHDVAVPVLQLFGYLDVDESPAIHCYDLHVDAVVNALEAYKQGPKQLEKFLLSNLQLEKFLIDIQLEEFPINKKKFLLALEKVLIANRNSSNNKRGRKPKPEVPGEPQSEEPQINRDYREIGNREEIVATSLQEDRTPAPIDLQIEKKKRETNPRMPALSVSHSQRLSEDDDPDKTEARIPTVPKLPVVNKPPTSQTPGAGVPLSLAVNPPVGGQDDAASGQAIPGSPSRDAAQRTITGTDGAVQASNHIPGAGKMVVDDQVNGANKVISTRPPMALTAKQIQKQQEHRAEEIFAIYEEKIGRKPSHSKANKDGALLLAQDDVSDEDIKTTIDEILKDSFMAKNLNLTYVHGKIDALARKPIPIQQQNSKAKRDENIGVSGLPRLRPPHREVSA